MQCITIAISFIKGWNSWNHFQCNINEKLIQQTADAIVATGLAAAGYQYSLSF
jgi:alpha-galactosidase